MAKTPKRSTSIDMTRVTRTIYFFLGFFALSIIVFDAGNLITREAVIDRWSIMTALLVVNTFAWFFCSRQQEKSIPIIGAVLASTVLGFAGFLTYWERGMASTSTIMYAIPLLIVATTKNRHALLATTALTIGVYSYAAVRYFNDFFNEGFRVQLWGTIIVFTGSVLTIAWLLLIVAGLRHDSK